MSGDNTSRPNNRMNRIGNKLRYLPVMQALDKICTKKGGEQCCSKSAQDVNANMKKMN